MRSTLNKVGRFNADPVLRAMIGQSKSTIDIERIMNTGRVLIVNLAKGRLGDKPAQLIGASLVSPFAQAAETRATIPESERRDFTLYVDEFQNYASLSFATIRSEARKWRLSLCLCNQFLAQLPEDLRHAVLGNVGTLVAFRVGNADAKILAAELGIDNAAALTDTPKYQAWVKLLRADTPSDAIPIRTLRHGHYKGTATSGD